jgi:hypothetical protein
MKTKKKFKKKSKLRLCAARGCNNRFKPYRPQQLYCSNTCRQRGFYDDYKDENGESPQWARIKRNQE